jgi:hypothetical protein
MHRATPARPLRSSASGSTQSMLLLSAAKRRANAPLQVPKSRICPIAPSTPRRWHPHRHALPPWPPECGGRRMGRGVLSGLTRYCLAPKLIERDHALLKATFIQRARGDEPVGSSQADRDGAPVPRGFGRGSAREGIKLPLTLMDHAMCRQDLW